MKFVLCVLLLPIASHSSEVQPRDRHLAKHNLDQDLTSHTNILASESKDDKPDTNKPDDHEDNDKPDKNKPDDHEDEGGDEDDDEPWEMTKFEKIWLQCGWLIQVVGCLAFYYVLTNHWPWKHGYEVEDKDGYGDVGSGTSVALYKLLWCESPMSHSINSLIVVVSLLNFTMFATESEAVFSPESPTPFVPDLPLKDWANTANWYVQLVSVAFFTLLFGLRMIAAQAHPNFRRYGRNAWLRWLVGSFFAQLELVAIIPSICDMITGQDMFINLVWLSLFRTINWMERRETSGIAVRQFRSVLKEEGDLLATMFIFGTVLWIVLSGLYYLTNSNNEETEWEAAVSKETGKKWQRFESIPSSMFFVLLNLCKENPLADFHVEFWSRLVVVAVCLLGTPLFALPTGVLGATIQNKTQDEIEAQEENNAAPEGDNDDSEVPLPTHWGFSSPARESQVGTAAQGRTPTLRSHTHPLLQSFEDGLVVPWCTAFLSFGSVFVYFFFTAGSTRLLIFLWINVGPVMLAYVDGIVGVIFAGEWFLRIALTPNLYIFSFLCAVDLVSWLPGVLHLVLFIMSGGTRNFMADMFGRWLLAACVLRVLKCERYCRAFHDMIDILLHHKAILKATLFITSLMWLTFTAILYFTERDSPDEEMRENYGSASRALWAEAINLHGEWVWCDYSSTGKAVCAVIALFSQGLFMIPICVFSDGFQDRLGSSDALEGGLEVEPWQASHRPARGHMRRPLYDLLYAHLHLKSVQKVAEVRKSLVLTSGSAIAPGSMSSSSPEEGRPGGRSRGRSDHDDSILRLSFSYRAFRFFSVLMVAGVTASSIILTTEVMEPSNCKKEDWCGYADWAWYIVDFSAAVFFSIELIMRIMSVGLHHPCSFVGFCDVASLVAIYSTLTPFRKYAFHPDYASESSLIDDMVVPVRLLRLFCLDSYLHPLHTLMRIVWVQRRELLRSGYAMVSFWYIFTTLMFLAEFDPQAISEADADAEADEPIMAQRYRDVLTGLQFALVHLTGDYPITEYTSAACVLHLFGILFGMCMVSAFTGIFVSGFMEHLKSERIVERKQEADRRLNQVLFTVVLVQRQFRRLRQRRIALEWARNAPEGTPLPHDLSSRMIEARNVERRQAQLRSALRSIVNQSTPEGERIMLVCNGALIVNIIATMILSMPEAKETYVVVQVLDLVDMLTGYIFLLDYMMRIGSSISASREILKPMRLIDLFCLLPTFVRMWFEGSAYSSRELQMHPRFQLCLQLASISRALRILDFAFVRRTGEKAFRAIYAALGSLMQPAVLALIVWITSTSVFFWCEHMYHGPDEENMADLLSALYWTSIYIIGEWANVDFSPGAGSRMCIFYCLFGVAVFAVPVGLMMEAVEATLTALAEEKKMLKNLMSKSFSRLPSLPRDSLPVLPEASEPTAEVSTELAEIER